MVLTAKQRFSITGDLLYPAALGAGIAWWVEAFIHWRAHPYGPASICWVLVFGVFFLVYHSRSFVILREEEACRETRRAGTRKGQAAPEYSAAEFTKDLIDCIALMLAFVCLRLPGGKADLADPYGAFTVAALIPTGALITQAALKKPLSWLLRLIATAVAGIGVCYAASESGVAFVPSCADWLVLGLLCFLLSYYVFWPHHFGVRTPAQRAEMSKVDLDAWQIARVVIAVVALLLVSRIVWRGIRLEAPEASSTETSSASRHGLSRIR